MFEVLAYLALKALQGSALSGRYQKLSGAIKSSHRTPLRTFSEAAVVGTALVAG